MLQLIANETAANIAILRRLLDRAALLMTRSSPIDVPGILRYLPRARYNSAMAANPRHMSWSRNRG
jgi:hypothetical protein